VLASLPGKSVIECGLQDGIPFMVLLRALCGRYENAFRRFMFCSERQNPTHRTGVEQLTG
jgi:hypothetical protein